MQATTGTSQLIYQLTHGHYFFLYIYIIIIIIFFYRWMDSIWEGLLQNPVLQNLSHISFSSFITSLFDSSSSSSSFLSISFNPFIAAGWICISVSSHPHVHWRRCGGRSPFLINCWRFFFLITRRHNPDGTL